MNNPCLKCKFKKECRSLSDYDLTCEEVERIATDYKVKGGNDDDQNKL